MKTYGSLFSGVGGADIGLENAGFSCEFQCEINEQATSVLRKHWPNVRRYTDVNHFPADLMRQLVGTPDVVWASCPCQAYSCAGARQSLDDPRGNMSLVAIQKINELDPEISLFENVPGWLNTKDNAFGTFLGSLVGHGEVIPGPDRGKWPNAGVVSGARRKIAYRVVDSQGWVPQRRRRVLVVAVRDSSRFDPVRMLFESEDEALRSATEGCWSKVFSFCKGLLRDSEESGDTRETVTALTATGVGTCGADDNQAQAGHLVVCQSIGAGFYVAQSPASGSIGYEDEMSPTLKSATGSNQVPGVVLEEPLAFNTTQITSKANRSNPQPGDACHPIAASDHAPLIIRNEDRKVVVRRLAPTECLRLQSWPDGWTAEGVTEDGKTVQLADGPQYRMIGNGVTAKVAEWIGARIQKEAARIAQEDLLKAA